MFKVTCTDKSDDSLVMEYTFSSLDQVNAFIYRQMDMERGERHHGSPQRCVYSIEML